MSTKERDIHKERRQYPKLWQEAIEKAFPYSDHRALELVTVTTASKEQAEREAKLAAEYNALKERGIKEGWLQWEGGYEGEYVTNPRRKGDTLTQEWQQNERRYLDNLKRVDAIYQESIKRVKEQLA